MPVRCQRMLGANVPAVDRFKGTSSSKKEQDHKIVRKIRKKDDDEYEVPAILIMRREDCVNVEPGYIKSRLWARFSVSD